MLSPGRNTSATLRWPGLALVASLVLGVALGATTTTAAATGLANKPKASRDTTPPSVSFVSPAAGATVRGLVSVSVKAHDNVGVAKVVFFLDGVVVQTSTAAAYGYTWDTTAVGDGSHTLKVNAYDAAGSVGTSSIGVTVSNGSAPPTVLAPDTTPPTVSFIAPTPGATVTGAVTVSATATDDVGVSSVQFQLDGVVVQTAATVPSSYSWDTTAVANTGHTLQAKAFDAAGNVGVSSISVTVNNAAPSVPAPAPSPSSCAGVPVSTTTDLQAAISATPNRTTFCIATGVHRLTQPLVLKSGDVLDGSQGAILDGAQNITAAFVASGSRWVASGQTRALTAATDVPC